MKFHAAILILSGLAPTLFGDTYPRQTGVDAIHYIFRLTLTDDNDKIAGEATADVRFLKGGLTEFQLDLATPNSGKGMTVSGVSCGGTAVRYRHTADRLAIFLPAPSRAGERRQCTVEVPRDARQRIVRF